MAQTSKQKQRLRRAKRRATLAERYVVLTEQVMPPMRQRLERLSNELVQTRVLLFGVIAQQGDSTTVTQGTMQQVAQSLARLSLETAPVEGDPQTIRLRMVEAPEASEQALSTETTLAYPSKALTVRKVEESEEVESFPGAHDLYHDPDVSHEVTRFEDEGNPNG